MPMSEEKRRQWREQSKKAAGGRNRENVFSLRDLKKERVRVVWSGEPDGDGATLKIGMHWFDQQPYRCPRVLADESCPACKLAARLRRSGDDKLKEIGQDVGVKVRWLFKILPRSVKPSKLQILEAPGDIADKIMEALDNDTHWGDITDVQEGRDVNISGKGEGRRRKYDAMICPDQRPLHKKEAVLARLLKQEKKLRFDDFLPAAGDLEKLIEEHYGTLLAELDEDDHPHRRHVHKKKTARPASAEKDDEDEGEEEEEEGEDDDSAKIGRKLRGQIRKNEKDNDDDEEEEEDDEEEGEE